MSNYSYHYTPEPPKKANRAGVVIAVIVMILAVLVLAWVIAVSMDMGQSGRMDPTPKPTAALEPKETRKPDEGPQSGFIPETEAPTDPEATPVPDILRPDTTPVLDGDTLTYSDVFGSVADIVEIVQPGVVAVTNQVKYGDELRNYSYGSGVVISTQGYIVTNAHVVNGADNIVVTCPDGKAYDAQLMGSDVKTDIAVLRVDTEELVAISIGESDDLRVGDLAIAIGNALSLDLSTSSATAGIVSALDRTVVSNNWPTEMIQIDAAINPGNSGGALVNGKGELVGICTMKEIIAGYSSSGATISAEGIGYAISTKELMPVVNDLILFGYVVRPTIGITGEQVTENIAKQNDWVTGVYITSITSGGGAEAAGMKEGDIITQADDTTVSALSDINSVIRGKSVGQDIQLTVWREGETLTFTVTLKEPQ